VALKLLPDPILLGLVEKSERDDQLYTDKGIYKVFKTKLNKELSILYRDKII